MVHPAPQDAGPTISAGPETIIQVREVILLSPAWADPFKVKVFVGPSLHFTWSGPAKAAGPMTIGTRGWKGAMKSVIFAEGEGDSLVFTKTVLTPMLTQLLKLLKSAVTSIAASAKVFIA